MTITNKDVERAYKLDQTIKQLTEEYDMLKARLRDDLEPNTYAAGDFEVVIRQPTQQIVAADYARFMSTYDPDDNPDIYELRPLPMSQLKKRLTTDELAPFISESKPAVIVRLAKK